MRGLHKGLAEWFSIPKHRRGEQGLMTPVLCLDAETQGSPISVLQREAAEEQEVEQDDEKGQAALTVQ